MFFGARLRCGGGVAADSRFARLGGRIGVYFCFARRPPTKCRVSLRSCRVSLRGLLGLDRDSAVAPVSVIRVPLGPWVGMPRVW